jgi:hypothetical protein
MMKSKSLPILAAAAALVIAFASPPATANIIKDASTSQVSQGFGNIPRLVTAETNAALEFSCNSNVGGALATAVCDTHDATFQGNGLINGTVGQDGNVAGPKNNLVSTTDPNFLVPITNANEIRLNYNPSQTGSAPQTDVRDITLKFYNASNVEVISIDGGCGTSCTGTAADSLFFADTGTNLGNGGVGFVLKLDQAEIDAVNAACGANFSGCKTIAGETTIDLANDGPDSFTLFTVPAPAIGHGLLVLLAVGGVLFSGKLLETLKKQRLQAV